MCDLELHLDESGSGTGQFTLAGYLFEASRLERFSAEWHDCLDRNHLPFFHMVDCAHGNQSFQAISKRDRVRLQMTLMRLIKKYSIGGFVINIGAEGVDPKHIYSLAAQRMISLLQYWARMVSFEGNLRPIFEDGGYGKGLVELAFKKAINSPAPGDTLRIDLPSFMPKMNNAGIQAADFLAWQYHNFTKKRKKQSLARLDFRALLRHPHLIKDDLGEPPRKSTWQSVSASRNRIETVFYASPMTLEEAKETAVFVFGKDDIKILHTEGSTCVFVCPECYRAICEIYPNQITSGFLGFKCWCGQLCKVSRVNAPFAMY